MEWMRMTLEVRSLSKNYGKVQALKNVSFKIDTGVYGLLGPNGAGKSTMIRIITGSMRASSGEVLYNGRRIRENEKGIKKSWAMSRSVRECTIPSPPHGSLSIWQC